MTLEMTSYNTLRKELDKWIAEGLRCRFWFRDDDTVSDTDHLRKLFEIMSPLQVRIAIAVVPKKADSTLVKALMDNDCCIWQHGWSHDYHKFGEFGEERPLDLMIEEANKGARLMDNLFGLSGWQKVFVPPHHMLSLPFKTQINQLGYLGISAGNPLTPKIQGIKEVNATIDIMNWNSRRVLDERDICHKLITELQARRFGKFPAEKPVGILTHHLAFDEGDWQKLKKLVTTICSHPAVEFEHADDLFLKKASCGIPQENNLSSTEKTTNDIQPGVTMVVTSCSRYDLLIRTLNSFFEFNTYPPYDIVVVEDGQLYDLPNNLLLDNRISFIATCRRVGQIKAIDKAYKHINTEYIFHCEDDWEFYAPGFIEKSLEILRSNQKVIQVWLRALNDTIGHPIIPKTFYASNVEFKLLETNHDGGKYGEWHGFSFNPGLKRKSDYLMLGSYGSLDPQEKLMSWEIESEVSKYYSEKGFVAAILADNEGSGYCKHIGLERHASEPFNLIALIKLVIIRLKTPDFYKYQTSFVILRFLGLKLEKIKNPYLKKGISIIKKMLYK